MSKDVQYWAASHVGRVRQTNEDAYFTAGMARPARQLAWSGQLNRDSHWAVVADGVGGHAAGEVASFLALECLGQKLSSCHSDDELRAVLAATHDEVHRAAAGRPDRFQMATTAAGLIFRGSTVIVFNIGDSRCYMFRRGVLRQISEDHVVGGNMLTRCVGGSALDAAEPFIDHVKPRIETRFLLCTDGISDELTDGTIQSILARSQNPASDLVSAALSTGGRDNATAVVIDYPR